MSYIGQQLPADVFSGFTTDSFTGDGSATTFTLSKAPFSEDGLIVVINNVIQKPTTNFTVSGTTLTIVGTAVASGDVIYAIHTSGAVPSTLASKVDVNGLSDGIILDADADTTISADTDDQIDVKIGGTDALRVTGTALTGNAVATIGASGTALSLAGITFYQGQSGSIYTADVSGTDNDAENNTAYGASAMDAITTGDNNTAMGEHALGALNTGADNVAIGYNAGSSMTTASYSTVVGRNAGASMVDSRLTAIGYYAGGATTHIGNTFVGFNTGAANTSGTYNVAMGYNALYQPDTESNNIAIGSSALSAAVAGGEANTAVGTNALDALTSGDENVAVGQHAGTAHTTGVDCVYIGESCGGSNVSGSYKTLVGCNANTNGNTDGHEIVIGYNLTGGGQNKVRLGSGSDYIENDYANNANWAHSSDERLKDNIQTDNLGLDFINELRTVTYNWKASDKVDTSLPGYIDADTTNFDKLCKDTSVTMNGLIAQEVKAALDKVGADASKYAVWSTDDDGIQRISESSFVMPLIKAVQELSAKVKALEDA